MSATVRDQVVVAGGIAYCLATSFLYYVTLVQFGLMHHFEQYLKLGVNRIYAALFVLAVFGIGGGILAGIALDRARPGIRRLLATIGAISILAFGLAFLSFEVVSFVWIAVIMAAMGLVLGTLMVTLLVTFSRFIHFRLRGIFAGISAAVAYLAANALAAFVDDPVLLGTINGFAIASNIIVIALVWDAGSGMIPVLAGKSGEPVKRFYIALLPLALIVFLDTYCFYPVGQQSFGPNPVLLLPAHWISNGVWHLLFGLILGLLSFSIGNRRLLLVGYAALFISAALLIGNHFESLQKLVLPAYSLVVMVYTLVLFSVWGEKAPAHRFGFHTAVGLALCGWLASGGAIAASMGAAKVLPLPYLFVPALALAPVGLLVTRRFFAQESVEELLEMELKDQESRS